MSANCTGYPSSAMGAGRVGLFGTGVMARGIAALCVANGFDLVLMSASPVRAAALRDELRDGGAAASCDPRDLGECGLFLEATVEEYGPKFEALREAEPTLPAEATVASTTSSLSITTLASCLERPERMVGLHFFK